MKYFILFILLITSNLSAQKKTFFSFDEALRSPEKVKILVLNYINPSTVPLDSRIGELTELEELVIFPDYFGENKNVKLNSLPDEILNCSKLQALRLSGCSLAGLPADFAKLEKLQLLELNGTSINISRELAKLTALPNLQRLELFGVSVDHFDRKRLASKEGLELFIDDVPITEKVVDLQFSDTYLVMRNSRDATLFLRSLPDEIRRSTIMYTAKD